MPSSYTTSLRLTLPANGELAGSWGSTVNTGVTSLAEAAIAGTAAVVMSDADYTLTVLNGGADQARNMFITLTGTLSVSRNVICPSVSKLYVVTNNTTGGQTITFKTSAGSGVAVANGQRKTLYCNGTNVLDATTGFTSLLFDAGTAGAPSIAFAGNASTGFWLPTTATLAASTAGVERLRINASGNIGIGTNAPIQKLHVVGDIQQENANYLRGKIAAGSSTRLFGLNASDTLYIGSVDANHTGGTLFVKNGIAQMVLDASGNLGIGTTPSAWGSALVGALQVRGASLTSNTTGTVSYLSSNLYYDGAYKYYAGGFASQIQQINGECQFLTAPSGLTGAVATLTTAMTLNASGNLGLGVTSPAYKLQVNSGAATTTARLQANSGVNPTLSFFRGSTETLFAEGTFYGGNVDYIQALTFAQAGTEKFRFGDGGHFTIGSNYLSPSTRLSGAAPVGSMHQDNSGNLGVGTSAPLNKLDIVGSFGRGAPVTKTANFTLAATENWLINNKSGSACTVTLPSASLWTGREVMIQNYQAQTVVSASANVVPKSGAAAGTAILPATVGSSVALVSNGTNWVVAADVPLPVLGTGVATWLGTPTSANLASAVTDETGSGSLVFATSPILVTPNLGTPSAVTLTSATGLPLTTGVTGTLPVANGGTGVTTSTGSGSNVLSTSPTLSSPTLVTPNLGTPSAVTLTSATGLPLTTGVTGTLPVANGGTGITSLGAGVATWLGTPSSTNLRAAVTDETGTGSLVFATSPTLVTPNLGTPSAVTLTSATGLPLTTGVTGTLPVANGGTGITALGTGIATWLGTPTSANLASAVTDETGSGSLVFATSPTLTTPTLGAATITSVNGGQIAGMRNRIINGDMQIDQRNAGSIVTNSSGYTVDRWGDTKAGSGQYSAQQVTTAPAGFRVSLLHTITTAVSPAASDVYQIYQSVEAFNTTDLAFGTASAVSITLSFWVRSSVTGTYSVSFSNDLPNGPTRRGYVSTYTVSTANTWEQKTITIPGDTAGTWAAGTNASGLTFHFDMGSGSNNNTTAGSWQTGTATNALRRTSGSVSLISTAGATFYLTGVQLEVGSTATPFEQRPYGTELALCQRYYTVIYVGLRFCSGAIPFHGTTITLPMSMRATPTLALGGSPSFNNVVAELLNNLASIGSSTISYQLQASLANTDTFATNRAILASAEL